MTSGPPGARTSRTRARENWPWLSAVVTEVCGPDEWQVEITDDAVATDQLGRPAGREVAEEDRWYPLAFRDSSELTEDEITQLAAMGPLSNDEPAGADGSYPEGTRVWITRRGADVFRPMIDHLAELDHLDHAHYPSQSCG